MNSGCGLRDAGNSAAYERGGVMELWGAQGREGEALRCGGLPRRGMQRKPFMSALTEGRGSGESCRVVSAAVIN